MSTMLDLDAILAFTIKLAYEAGEMILEGQAKRFASQGSGQSTKSNGVDLVTEVDKAVETFLTSKIRDAYPDHKLSIGEETYSGEALTGDPTWIVDPIDGTTNFIHGFPMVATSIGLAVNGIPVVGVVYNPLMNQLYSAAKGRGAFLNQTTRLPLTGSPQPLGSLAEALIGFEFGTSSSSRLLASLASKTRTFQLLAAHADEGGKSVHGLRDIGSAALNICLVAAGSLDIHWEIGCWIWDVCAGICILDEAGGACFGGKTTELDGMVNAQLMSGRKYLFIRDIANALAESTLESQVRFAREFYDTTEDTEP